MLAYTNSLHLTVPKKTMLRKFVLDPVVQERLRPMLVLHGFADEAPLLELAARVAAGGATNLRDALRHLHSEIRFRFKDIAEADLPGGEDSLFPATSESLPAKDVILCMICPSASILFQTFSYFLNAF